MEKNSTGTLWTVICIGAVVLWLMGVMYLFVGFVAGTLTVLGLMMTIERIPGFWAFATTTPGTIIVLFGTGLLSHVAFGTSTIIGTIAFAWSLILKIMVIRAKREERLARRVAA